jgi:hypothetical protein
MQRPLVVQVQPLEGLTDLALPPHSRPSPRPQIEQRRVRARRAVEGVHAAQHARCRRKRAQPASYSDDSHAPQIRPTQLRAQVRPHLPGEARPRGAHKRAPACAAQRAAARGARAWARWPRCWRRFLRERGGQAVEWVRRGARHGLSRCREDVDDALIHILVGTPFIETMPASLGT